MLTSRANAVGVWPAPTGFVESLVGVYSLPRQVSSQTSSPTEEGSFAWASIRSTYPPGVKNFHPFALMTFQGNIAQDGHRMALG